MIEAAADLVRSGRIAEIALAILCLEAVVLIVLCRQRRRADQLPGLLAHIAAGACLLLALRAALVDASWLAVALPLAGALVAHTIDLAIRLSR